MGRTVSNSAVEDLIQDAFRRLLCDFAQNDHEVLLKSATMIDTSPTLYFYLFLREYGKRFVELVEEGVSKEAWYPNNVTLIDLLHLVHCVQASIHVDDELGSILVDMQRRLQALSDRLFKAM